MENKDMCQQINNAFDFMQKMYNEISFMIKEIQGQLAEKEFYLLKPKGYGISSRSSTGLDIDQLPLWLLRQFAVAFTKNVQNKENKSRTETELQGNDNLKILYFRIILHRDESSCPQLLFGLIKSIKTKQVKKPFTKFEQIMGHLEYDGGSIFSKPAKSKYEDKYIEFQYNFQKVNLLDINSSSDLNDKVIEPSIKMYDKI
ncbi:MAG: hypothetical protein K9M99_09230 [Candidatus Cloacimonetes bacterium]|nr:hypothetical protein [Candidatus Cloacimonadota bacterium]